MIDDDLDYEKADLENAKEARRIQKLFREVFKNDEGEECLQIIENIFQLHLPSMPAQNWNRDAATYMDGQKSVILEIRDIMRGKYTKKEKNNNE